MAVVRSGRGAACSAGGGESAASTVSASYPRGSRGRETMGWVRGSGHRTVRRRSDMRSRSCRPTCLPVLGDHFGGQFGGQNGAGQKARRVDMRERRFLGGGPFVTLCLRGAWAARFRRMRSCLTAVSQRRPACRPHPVRTPGLGAAQEPRRRSLHQAGRHDTTEAARWASRYFSWPRTILGLTS